MRMMVCLCFSMAKGIYLWNTCSKARSQPGAHWFTVSIPKPPGNCWLCFHGNCLFSENCIRILDEEGSSWEKKIHFQARGKSVAAWHPSLSGSCSKWPQHPGAIVAGFSAAHDGRPCLRQRSQTSYNLILEWWALLQPCPTGHMVPCLWRMWEGVPQSVNSRRPLSWRLIKAPLMTLFWSRFAQSHIAWQVFHSFFTVTLAGNAGLFIGLLFSSNY